MKNLIKDDKSTAAMIKNTLLSIIISITVSLFNFLMASKFISILRNFNLYDKI